MTTIVKVQRALFPKNAPALIYDRKQSWIEQRSLGCDVAADLGSDPKGYFQATLKSDGGGKCWIIGNRVKDQDW